MKYIIITPVVMLIMLCSCNNTQHHNARIKSFMQGRYVRAFEEEYAIGNDTLIIQQPNTDNNYYIIQHRSSFRRRKNKKLLSKEYNLEKWIAIFDNQDNVLIEQKNGKLFSFLPDENSLLFGSSKFLKIQ